MPIYEYQCKECGHSLEAIQKFSDAPLSECPVCLKAGLTKLLSAPSFRLKGGGWYETDFKTGNKRHGTQDSGSGDGAKTGSSSSDSRTGEATPASSPAGGAKPASTPASPGTAA